MYLMVSWHNHIFQYGKYTKKIYIKQIYNGIFFQQEKILNKLLIEAI